MARPRKKTRYNPEKIAEEFIEAVTDAYLNPTDGTAESDGHMQLNLLAEEFSITPLKARKLLITS